MCVCVFVCVFVCVRVCACVCVRVCVCLCVYRLRVAAARLLRSSKFLLHEGHLPLHLLDACVR